MSSSYSFTPEQEKQYHRLSATSSFSYPLRHKHSLPSEWPDNDLTFFMDKEHETSIKLIFPETSQYGNAQDRTILLTFPPHRHHGRSAKPFKAPFATVTFPSTVSYDDVKAVFEQGRMPTQISGVRVKFTDSAEPASTWDLRSVTGRDEVTDVESWIRTTILNAGGHPTQRDHLVPVQWDRSGRPTKALHMIKAAEPVMTWIPTPGGGYYGYP